MALFLLLDVKFRFSYHSKIVKLPFTFSNCYLTLTKKPISLIFIFLTLQDFNSLTILTMLDCYWLNWYFGKILKWI